MESYSCGRSKRRYQHLPDPQTRDHDLKQYKINPLVRNTVILYKDYKAAATFVDLDAADFDRLTAAVNNLR